MARTLTPNERALRAILERDWQATVVLHARTAGWMVHFIPDNFHKRAKEEHDYTRQGDRGYPDITICREGEIIFAELKRVIGYLSPEQEVWRDRLISAGMEYHVWRPDMLEGVIQRLYGNRVDYAASGLTVNPPMQSGESTVRASVATTPCAENQDHPGQSQSKPKKRGVSTKRSGSGESSKETTQITFQERSELVKQKHKPNSPGSSEPESTESR